MLISVTVFAAILALSSATRFKECGSANGKVKSVTVTPCSEFPCILHRGTTASVAIEFVSNVNSKTLTGSVHGILGGFPIPFPIPQTDGCQSGVACPITAGSSHIYKASIPVHKLYPSVKVIVKWELQGDNGENIACINLPVEIMD
ncbi:NPC intracellular cholesterol transporter 2-like [Tubulanus polymorphus]|uniref:NPC intracellular cholesterol transporter 2-like n=1 Tax=Tubulanus polymorphus TaxID=672921 RepID=UPI003DA241AA